MVSGNVLLPKGEVAPKGKEISVQSYDDGIKLNFHRQYLIPAGTTKYDYVLYLVPGSQTKLTVTKYDGRFLLGKYDGLIDTSSGNVTGINVVIDP